MEVDVPLTVTLSKRISMLAMNCKRHQVFREKRLEAQKQAEIGLLSMQLAEALFDNPTAQKLHYENAAEALSRAKRLCRDVLRGKEGADVD